jgi:DNA-binding CsgD family transcriptional regulator
VLGIALQLQGRLDEADRVLRAASRTAQTDDERTEAALARARNLHWAMGDRAAALRVLDDELGRVEDEAAKGALETEAALFHAVVGALDRAESVAAEALQRSGLGPRTELNALVVLTLAYCVQGRLGELSSVLDRALELARAHRADEPLAEGQLLLNHAHTLMFDDVERSWLLARRYAAQPSPLLGMWRATVGLCELAMGRVTDAVVTLREATHRLQRMDPFGNLDMVRCMHALATARLRDAEGLRRTLGQVDRDLAEREPRTRLWLRRAEACGHGLAGEFDLASDIAAHAGEEAIAASHLTWGAEALYDAVRFGAADRVATSLEELAKQTDVTVIRLFADHAAALAGRDAAGLERVATRLVAANRPLAAAEAFAQAAGSTDPEEGDRHAGSLLRAAALTRRSPGAWVVALDAHGAALSAREAEIATLVAQGLTNRDIAERLFLSHRTVENHLARVYGRFGLTGRDQLRRALGDRFVGKTP